MTKEPVLITIHHLGVSQSDRIVWLLEELGLPYELKWYNRKDGLAPPEYLALHPTATAPVIQDGDRVITESAVICEYICHRHAGGRLTVGPAQPNYADYLYWMHLNNNLLGLFFAKLSVARTPGAAVPGVIQRREDAYFRFLEQTLAKSPYLAGPEFTCADVMVTFNLTSLPLFGGRKIDDLANVQAYVKRISERPAYVKAMKIAGPGATPPTS
jgi:glutathione S-transferase